MGDMADMVNDETLQRKMKMPIGKGKTTKKPAKTAKATPKKEPAYKPQLFSASGKEDLENMAINLVGLPTGGKTFTALSISEQWPRELKLGGRLTMLEDVIHIGFDRGALVGLTQFNIKARYRVDVPKMMGVHKWNIREAMDAVLDEAYEMADKLPNLKACIVDTVTRFDRFLVAHWMDAANIPVDWNDNEDTRAAYGKIFRDHHAFNAGIVTLPLRPIFCFHYKAVAPIIAKKEDAKKAAKAKQVLQTGEGGAQLVPAITGQASEVYFGDAAIEMTCRAVKSPSTKQWKYTVHPDGYQSEAGKARGKNRFREVLDETEDANLRKLLAKIEAV